MRLLIVEDEPTLGELLRRNLAARGFAVDLAQSRSMERALEKAGKDAQLLVLKEANEELNNPADRRMLLEALERFFGQHCR